MRQAHRNAGQPRLTKRGEGKDPRFGVIDFAIGADVTEAFRAAVQATAESEWKPLIRMFDGKPQATDQEWAEVCYGDAQKWTNRMRLCGRPFHRVRFPLGPALPTLAGW